MDVSPRSRVGGRGLQPHPRRQRMPVLRREEGRQGQLAPRPIPEGGARVASRTQRRSDRANRYVGLEEADLVAVSSWARVAGTGPRAELRQGLPVLRTSEDRRRQHPRGASPRSCRAVAPDPEPTAQAGSGVPGRGAQGVVALPGRASVAGDDQQPLDARDRLPLLQRPANRKGAIARDTPPRDRARVARRVQRRSGTRRRVAGLTTRGLVDLPPWPRVARTGSDSREARRWMPDVRLTAGSAAGARVYSERNHSMKRGNASSGSGSSGCQRFSCSKVTQPV